MLMRGGDEPVVTGRKEDTMRKSGPERRARWAVWSAVIAGLVLAGAVVPARAALTTPSCLAKKLKAWGNLRKCQATENGKALQSKPADLLKCQTKLDNALGKLDTLATALGIGCRYHDNGDGTATDYDTGLQWEQKTGSVGSARLCRYPSCPAGDAFGDVFTGTYSASSPCSGGTFTISVDVAGVFWSGTTSGDSYGPCNDAMSGSISGTTLTGTGPLSTTISGTIDCSNAAATGTIAGAVNGNWSVTTQYCSDPHDVNDAYTWTDTAVVPNGSAFKLFLGSLNHCGTLDGTTLFGGFAGHCDWRLPAVGELSGIVDPGASGCGSGSPCIDQSVFGPTAAHQYWSAIPFSDITNLAWYVNFLNGSANQEDRFSAFWVRAVRSAL